MLLHQTANPMLPLWIVAPLAVLSTVVIGGHLAALQRADMPASRRRIRTANGVVLLGLTLLLAYAIGCVGMLPSGGGSIGHIREFVLVWMAIIGLVPMVLGLAGLDVVNTIRLQRGMIREIRGRMRGDMLRDVEIRVHARLGAGGCVSHAGTGADQNSGGAGDHAERG